MHIYKKITLPPMTEKHTCSHLDQLPAIAERLMELHKGKRVFAFYGEMGAGKTTFIKTICKMLEVVDPVSSPTFAIVNEYATSRGDSVFHFDLYRLKSWTEMLEIGYEEYFYSGQLCLLEWPEKISELLPDETVRVEILVSGPNNERTITF